MTQLGAWTAFIDEPDMSAWYSLPGNLQAECGRYRPDGTELQPLAADQFARIHAAAVRYAQESVAGFKVPYHGPEHFRQTEERGLQAVAVFERLRSLQIPLAVKQNLALALRLHDCHHCGSTFRADATRPEMLHLPHLPQNVSAEWVSAVAANELGLANGLVFPARLFQTMVIWTSTFGGAKPRGQELGIPDIQPSGLWGRIMRAADVCPPDDFMEWIRAGIAVNYGETPAAPAPTTWDGYVQGCLLGFIDHYITRCYSQLDESAGVALTQALGWRDTLAAHRASVVAMANGQDDATRSLVQAELSLVGAF